MSIHLISTSTWRNLVDEQTDAHRVGTTSQGWIDRFGSDYLVSTTQTEASDALVTLVHKIGKTFDSPARRIFRRLLVKQPGASDIPELVHGDPSLPLESVVHENGIPFEVHFGTGYSVGLFMDQRLNRRHLVNLRPARVLNCFSYTCAFSVVAARSSAQTCSVDLAKKALAWGRRNFDLNALDAGDHRWIADDVLKVLPRMARRGEQFDAIILDPPTFSRGTSGGVLRAVDDFPRLIDLARSVAAPAASILLSTNSRNLRPDDLVRAARLTGPIADVCQIPPPIEYPAGSAASTTWVRLPD